MTAFVDPNYFTNGYHISYPFKENEGPIFYHPKYFPLTMNLLNAVGYIPLLGIITGIVRLKLLDTKMSNSRGGELQGMADQMRLRAWLEIAGFGFLFLIPDIIFTIGREIQIAKGEFYIFPTTIP